MVEGHWGTGGVPAVVRCFSDVDGEPSLEWTKGLHMKKYNYDGLAELLDVKAPLLMLDRLFVDSEGGTAEGVRHVSMNDPVFLGHFPGHPVTPGVLQVAAMEQAARALFLSSFAGNGPVAIHSLRRVKFRQPVEPGMSMRIECHQNGEPVDGKVEYEARILVEDEMASSAFITLCSRGPSWFEPDVEEGAAQFMKELPDGARLLKPEDIMGIIPHRYPFLHIDGAYDMGSASEIFGYKNIEGNDPFVAGTVPPFFLEPLHVEAGAQLGCVALLALPENRGKLGFFMSIDSAEFFMPVLPGERMAIRMECESHGRFGVARGENYVGASLASRYSLKFAILAPDMLNAK